MRSHDHGVAVLGADLGAVGSILNMIYPGVGSIASGLGGSGGQKPTTSAQPQQPTAEQILAAERARQQAEHDKMVRNIAIASAGVASAGLLTTVLYLILRRRPAGV